MSVTRPKAGSPEHQRQQGALDPLNESSARESDSDGELEELGDDAIIAQQTAAHALQPRANVSEESRSVVITEHPAPRDSQPPRKSSAEATLVIRDRRALDEMRQKIIHRQKQKEAHGRRTLYLWGALGLAAFVLGGIVAFLATDIGSEPQTAETRAPGDAQLGPRSTPAAQPLPNGSPVSPPRALRAEDLPVQRKP